MQNATEKLKEMSEMLNSFDSKKVNDDMYELVNRLSSSGKVEDIEELRRIQEKFDNLSQNLLNLAEFVGRRYKGNPGN